MKAEYTKEQIWKLYEKLPDDLKEAVFAEKTADDIYSICTRNNIEEAKIPEVARLTGNVLLGILPPEEFRNTLKKELNLEKDIVEKIGFQIERIIFFPVKKELNEIYTMKTTPKSSVEEKAKTNKKDVYREPIE
ncbi:hypothetical protein KAU51_03260 [Candidatus Parcubacteria bacterium]|nr:hypothetical protein [Candidatus Parcubacteria bacterium]